MRAAMVDRHTAAAFAERMTRAAAAQRHGDLAAATAEAEAALALVPGQPEALRWLGDLARARGDEAQAEAHWRASLATNEAQPAIWNNLGNLLARTNHVEASLAAFARAIALQPDYAEAHYNLARVLHRAGHGVEAAASLQNALALKGGPREAMLQLAARLQENAGRLDEALGTLEMALQRAPGKPALHHNRGVLLQRLNRPAEALAAFEAALARGAADADTHYNRANALQALGRAEEAIAAYRLALAAHPQHGLALYDLARLRWRLGDDAFDEELQALAAGAPASPLGPGLRGHLLARAERHAEAEAAFAEALRRAPEAAGFHDGHGRTLSRQARHAEALAAHARAVALAPGDGDLHAHQAAALLAAGRPEAAEEAAARACTLNPNDQHAWAQRGLAWRCTGDARAAWLHDMDRFVGVYDMPPPEGFSDIEAFHKALAAELGALHRDRREPVDQTLRRGTQTMGNLFDQRHPLVDALKARIAQAVTHHVAALPLASNAPAAAGPGAATHPLLGRANAARRLGWRYTDSWSSRLARGGFHTHHVHPHGWMSSAYYVRLPPSAQEGPAGWIQFGAPDRDLGLPPLRLVQPLVGRLVLFPSYLWHGTLPFDDDAERLTIAFDIVPAG